MSFQNNFLPKAIALVVVFLLLVVLPGCDRLNQSVKTPKASLENNSTVAGEIAVIESNVIILKPLNNAKIKSPLEVSGRALSDDGMVYIRLLDVSENILATTTAQINVGPLAWGDYRAKLEFEQPFVSRGWLEVFRFNPRTNAPADLIRLPIRFEFYQTVPVELFFGNLEKQSRADSCNEVFSVVRNMEITSQILLDVLVELLRGVSVEEEKQGFFSLIPAKGVMINNIKIENGSLTVEFSRGLFSDIDSECQKNTIRAQIIKTLTQFEGIEEVVITSLK